MDFGDRLREARQSNNLTQKELADILGISPNCVGNYERGESFPRQKYLYDIFKLLGLDANYLFQDALGIDTGYWFEERLLLSSYRAMDKRTRKLMSRIASMEVEKILNERMLAKSPDLDFLCFICDDGVYGHMAIAADEDKMKFIEKPGVVKNFGRADFHLMIKGNGMEPRFEDGTVLGINYAQELAEKQLGLFNADGYAVFVYRNTAGKYISVRGERLSFELNEKKPVLYGRVVTGYPNKN